MHRLNVLNRLFAVSLAASPLVCSSDPTLPDPVREAGQVVQLIEKESGNCSAEMRRKAGELDKQFRLYEINRENTKIFFEYSILHFADTRDFETTSGWFAIDPDRSRIQGEIWIDARSIRAVLPYRQIIAGDTFLSSEQHQFIKFTPKGITGALSAFIRPASEPPSGAQAAPAEPLSATVVGDLSIKGIQHQVDFVLYPELCESASRSPESASDTLVVCGRSRIDKVTFDLGKDYTLLSKDIKLRVSIQATRCQPVAD